MLQGHFLTQSQRRHKPHQVPPNHVAYRLQESFYKELKRLQEQQMLMPLWVDETAEWCNSFILMPKPNGTV